MVDVGNGREVTILKYPVDFFSIVVVETFGRKKINGLFPVGYRHPSLKP